MPPVLSSPHLQWQLLRYQALKEISRSRTSYAKELAALQRSATQRPSYMLHFDGTERLLCVRRRYYYLLYYYGSKSLAVSQEPYCVFQMGQSRGLRVGEEEVDEKIDIYEGLEEARNDL